MEKESKEGRKRPIGREMQNREYPTAANKTDNKKTWNGAEKKSRI